jgi:hypothetical protein
MVGWAVRAATGACICGRPGKARSICRRYYKDKQKFYITASNFQCDECWDRSNRLRRGDSKPHRRPDVGGLDTYRIASVGGSVGAKLAIMLGNY